MENVNLLPKCFLNMNDNSLLNLLQNPNNYGICSPAESSDLVPWVVQGSKQQSFWMIEAFMTKIGNETIFVDLDACALCLQSCQTGN